MKTIYDTNILIDYPSLLEEKDNIVIPLSVLEELEELKYKKRLTYRARKAINYIMSDLENIEILNDYEYRKDTVDETLIQIAKDTGYKLVTQDSILYLIACSKIDNLEYYEENKYIYSGVTKGCCSPELIDKLFNEGFLKEDELEGFHVEENSFVDLDRVIVRKTEGKYFKLEWETGQPFISKDFTLNRRQLMAHDLLMDSTVPLVAIWGKYGTGKTSLTVRTALKLFNKDMYENIIVTRPKIESGFKEEHLGTLPGDVQEKYTPYLKPFEDNSTPNQFKMFEVQPLSTIKGRDIKNTIFIVDEAQDINPEKMPMIIERLGENSKLVLLGDPNQIDNRYLNKYNNGLTFTINNLKGNPHFGCVKLEENERSEVAMLGEELRKCLI